MRSFWKICGHSQLFAFFGDLLFCVVFRSAYSRRPIRDAGDLIVLLCVVFRSAFFLLFSGAICSACIVLRCFSVGLFIQSEFPCKARCASFLRKTYAIQVFCGDFVIRNFLRIVLFSFFIAIRFILSQFYCIPHSGSIMAFAAAVRQAVRRRCCRCTAVRAYLAVRLLLPFPLKNAPQRSETAITVARTGQLTLDVINLNYWTGSRTMRRHSCTRSDPCTMPRSDRRM